MDTFYRQLFQGESKAAALRSAQRSLLQEVDLGYEHPYFWAPFFLTGDTGRL
jgi:CHAT domain-containing protein